MFSHGGDRWSGGEGRIDWGKEREGGMEGEKGWGQKTAAAETESKATSNARPAAGKMNTAHQSIINYGMHLMIEVSDSVSF